MDVAALQVTLRRFATELLQLADQTAISLHAGPGTKTHVFVDWENVQPDEARCRALVPEATDVWLFHGPNQANVGRHYGSFGDRATEVRIARTGKNALDFHLSFYVGYIAGQQPDARLVVLSNDKGYAPMLDHARELGFVASQSGVARVKAVPAPRKAAARKAAAKATPARKAAPTPEPAAAPKPARKVAAKKASARKVAAKKAASPPSARASTAKKSFEQVLALLQKTAAASRPRKHARLLGFVASRLGVGSEADAEAMLARLAAEGKIAVDEKWNVAYRL